MDIHTTSDRRRAAVAALVKAYPNNSGSPANCWFETFYIRESEIVRDVLTAGGVAEDTLLRVTETKSGKLGLLIDPMAYAHLAEGQAVARIGWRRRGTLK